jgi:hypothetical protein
MGTMEKQQSNDAFKSMTRKGDLEGKKPWGLVDFEAMRHLAPHYAGGLSGANWLALECMLDVLVFGAKKYAPNNWKKGYKLTGCANSLYRHIKLLANGERFDEETGISHYGHILCNLMFMSYYVDYQPTQDDRVTSGIGKVSVIKHAELPRNEQECLSLMLECLGAFMNGNDNDTTEELPLLGYAMYYACHGYALQVAANKPNLGERFRKALDAVTTQLQEGRHILPTDPAEIEKFKAQLGYKIIGEEVIKPSLTRTPIPPADLTKAASVGKAEPEDEHELHCQCDECEPHSPGVVTTFEGLVARTTEEDTAMAVICTCDSCCRAHNQDENETKID